MAYRVKVEFGLSTRTKDFPKVDEARRSADELAAFYAPKYGRATTTVYNEAGEAIYVRVTNARTLR